MSGPRRPRRIATWLACVAALASALLPPFAQAMAAEHDLPAVVAELCSAGGRGGWVVIWAPAAPEQAPADAPAGRGVAGGAGHCPACLLSFDPQAPIPASAAAFTAAAPQAVPSTMAAPGPAPAPAWRPANPRAPPPPG